MGKPTDEQVQNAVPAIRNAKDPSLPDPTGWTEVGRIHVTS